MPTEKTDQEILEEAFDEAINEDAGIKPKASPEENHDDGSNEEPDGNKDQQNTDEQNVTPQDADTDIFNSVPQNEDNADADDTDQQNEPDYKALYEAEIQKTRSWEGRVSAADRRANEAEAALKEAQKKTTQDKPTLPEDGGDDDEVLQAFITDYPELEKPLKVLVQKEATSIAKEQLKSIQPTVEKLQQQSQKSTVAAHFNSIETAHPGWQQVVKSGALRGWIEAQPAFLQGPLNDVYKSGSAEQVIEMLDSFKRSTKQKTTPDAQPSSNKAAQLLAVPSSPSGGPTMENKDDQSYEDAWSEATASEV